MKLFTENFLLAISIFFIGILLSIIISKLSKIFFKKISKRTKTNFDDFIFEVTSGIVKPIGFLLSFYFSIDYFFTDEITFISVLLNILKLFILIIIIKALNKVLIISDAMGSRNYSDHEIALQRMLHEGATITTTESIIFELCKTADRKEFKEIRNIIIR